MPSDLSLPAVDVLPRILLVDDDPGTRKVLGQLLDLEGYYVDCCANSSDALIHLRGRPYDVLLTDYTMPGMSGLALARTAQATHEALRCIVMTGMQKPAGEELGAVTWYYKPIDFDELLRLLRN